MINIQNLKITNFKGIRSLEINLNSEVTNIYGANATGKTSVYDSFLWLLFGKDSTDRTDFNIRPIEDGKSNNTVETEVYALLTVEDRKIELRRVFKPKWVKARGTAMAEYAGNETMYYYNDVPLKQADYKAKIDAIIDEKLFRLLTNPAYFNQTLKWQDRRSMLIEMAGTISQDDILSGIQKPDYKDEIALLVGQLNAGKSVKEYQAELASKRKRIKQEFDTISPRLDEAQRQYKEAPVDLSEHNLTESLIETDKNIATINNAIEDVSEVWQSKIAEYNNTRKTLYDIEAGIKTAEAEAEANAHKSLKELQNKKAEYLDSMENANRLITAAENKAKSLQKQIDSLQQSMTAKREQWNTTNSQQPEFGDNETNPVCPACKRDLDEEFVQEQRSKLIAEFNADKVAKLSRIQAEGLQMKSESEQLAEDLKKTNNDIVAYQTQYSEFKAKYELIAAEIKAEEANIDNFDKSAGVPDELKQRYLETLQKYEGMKSDYDNMHNTVLSETEELKVKRTELTLKRDEINAQIQELKSIATHNEGVKKRIEELKDQNLSMAQQMAELEKMEYITEAYLKAENTMLETKVNSMFEYVKFRMFTPQINGGYEPTCEVLLNGVPYPDVNTAGKIIAGIDIINTFSKRYGQYAPIFLDNRESVTNIPETKSQIINLIVSPEHKSLKVN